MAESETMRLSRTPPILATSDIDGLRDAPLLPSDPLPSVSFAVDGSLCFSRPLCVDESILSRRPNKSLLFADSPDQPQADLLSSTIAYGPLQSRPNTQTLQYTQPRQPETTSTHQLQYDLQQQEQDKQAQALTQAMIADESAGSFVSIDPLASVSTLAMAAQRSNLQPLNILTALNPMETFGPMNPLLYTPLGFYPPSTASPRMLPQSPSSPHSKPIAYQTNPPLQQLPQSQTHSQSQSQLQLHTIPAIPHLPHAVTIPQPNHQSRFIHHSNMQRRSTHESYTLDPLNTTTNTPALHHPLGVAPHVQVHSHLHSHTHPHPYAHPHHTPHSSLEQPQIHADHHQHHHHQGLESNPPDPLGLRSTRSSMLTSSTQGSQTSISESYDQARFVTTNTAFPQPAGSPTLKRPVPRPRSESTNSLWKLELTTNAQLNDRIDKLMSCVMPQTQTNEYRLQIFNFVKGILEKALPEAKIFSYGSTPLRSYLPDGDIDVEVFVPPHLNDSWSEHVRRALEDEEKHGQTRNSPFSLFNIVIIPAEFKIIKCTVDNIVVDISANTLGGLRTLRFFEEVDSIVGRETRVPHLFKKSIVLIKAWCYYESRVLGSHHGLISTYALCTMILYLFNTKWTILRTPFQALVEFLDVYSQFNWDENCLSIYGPLPCKQFSENPSQAMARHVQSNPDTYLLSFTKVSEFGAKPAFPGSDLFSSPLDAKFLQRCFNIVDPLKPDNNIGRSVNKASQHRISSAFRRGYETLIEIFKKGPTDSDGAIYKFYRQVNLRHATNERIRPDLPGSHKGLHCFKVPERYPGLAISGCQSSELSKSDSATELDDQSTSHTDSGAALSCVDPEESIDDEDHTDNHFQQVMPVSPASLKFGDQSGIGAGLENINCMPAKSLEDPSPLSGFAASTLSSPTRSRSTSYSDVDCMHVDIQQLETYLAQAYDLLSIGKVSAGVNASSSTSLAALVSPRNHYGATSMARDLPNHGFGAHPANIFGGASAPSSIQGTSNASIAGGMNTSFGMYGNANAKALHGDDRSGYHRSNSSRPVPSMQGQYSSNLFAPEITRQPTFRNSAAGSAMSNGGHRYRYSNNTGGYGAIPHGAVASVGMNGMASTPAVQANGGVSLGGVAAVGMETNYGGSLPSSADWGTASSTEGVGDVFNDGNDRGGSYARRNPRNDGLSRSPKSNFKMRSPTMYSGHGPRNRMGQGGDHIQSRGGRSESPTRERRFTFN
eukprot:TRINITY_DN8364_c0_g2_i1.p1 TRINITY_DN8364_c0_g2~~TRINITY_DN8364_c0_g2_i1.p1  ORF type:complete len:1257 (-),score=180.12 TRINITY_DN8364_c0_g2_i1:258-3932(-)